jgi:hypothetical protein
MSGKVRCMGGFVPANGNLLSDHGTWFISPEIEEPLMPEPLTHGQDAAISIAGGHA